MGRIILLGTIDLQFSKIFNKLTLRICFLIVVLHSFCLFRTFDHEQMVVPVVLSEFEIEIEIEIEGKE